MFDRIAGVYDVMNSVMTAGLHHRWRERAADLARVPLPTLDIYRDRLLGAIAHGDGDKDQAVLAREQARACGLE